MLLVPLGIVFFHLQSLFSLCLANLIEFVKEVTKVIDEGRAVDVTYMGLIKAFDKVPHPV